MSKIFTSRDNATATVTNDGLVYGRAVGNTAIEVRDDKGNYLGQVPVEVVPENSYIPTTGISLNKTSVTLRYAYEYAKQLKATVSPSNATNKAVTWTSSDNTAVTCTNGYVKSLKTKGGNFTITATAADGQKATCQVTVVPNGTFVTSATPSSITATTAEESVYTVRLGISNLDGYYSGVTVGSSGSNAQTSRTFNNNSTEMILTLKENWGNANTFTLYVHGNFSGDEGVAIEVTQPASTKVSRLLDWTEGYCNAGGKFYFKYDEYNNLISSFNGSLIYECAVDSGAAIASAATVNVPWLHLRTDTVRLADLGSGYTAAQVAEYRNYGTINGSDPGFSGKVASYSMSISVDANTSSAGRTGIITFPGDVKFTVYQDGAQ